MGDFTKIKKRGKLIAITDNNANCYYIYKNQPMGMEYELLKGFADKYNLELEIKTPDWQKMPRLIKCGRADIFAANLTITDKRKKSMAFSDGIMPIQQFIISHINNDSIKCENDLAGKEIHIRKNTSYHERLLQLQKSGIDLKLVLYNDLPSEEFIRMVSAGEIELTVSDSHIAHLNRRYYPDIQLAFPIEKEQWLGWAINKKNDSLLTAINEYLDEIKSSGEFDRLNSKYYGSTEIFDYVDLLRFHERLESRLPKYEDKIKIESAKYGFDWCLIAAMIYQESHFNPRAKSYTGVRGLMQLTLLTAKEMGINNRLNPDQSITGGVKYLSKLNSRFSEIPEHDRIYFTLAAYNIGYGHIRDAQQLAISQGLDENSWESLKQTLPMLRFRKYYKSTKYGYARGTEPVRYVERIKSYYEILRRKVIEQPEICETLSK